MFPRNLKRILTRFFPGLLSLVFMLVVAGVSVAQEVMDGSVLPFPPVLSASSAFTASETLDVGTDLGSPVSLDYEERRPFAFSGEIEAVTVVLQ